MHAHPRPPTITTTVIITGTIEVYIEEKLIYTFQTKVPGGRTALNFYVGIGYKAPLVYQNWNKAMPSFRFTAF